MNPLKEMVDGRSGSAITEMLEHAPKLVSNAQQISDELPEFSIKSIFSGSDKKQSSAPIVTEPDEEDKPDYIPLTASEMEIKAETKTEMWAAIMAMIFELLNRVIAMQSLQKGDKELVKEYEETTRILGKVPDYPGDHPYFNAKLRWDDFTNATKEGSEINTLNVYQKGLLKKAIKADIEKKNRKKQMKDPTIAEAILEIALAKAGPQAVLLFTTKFSSLSSKLR